MSKQKSKCSRNKVFHQGTSNRHHRCKKRTHDPEQILKAPIKQAWPRMIVVKNPEIAENVSLNDKTESFLQGSRITTQSSGPQVTPAMKTEEVALEFLLVTADRQTTTSSDIVILAESTMTKRFRHQSSHSQICKVSANSSTSRWTKVVHPCPGRRRRSR